MWFPFCLFIPFLCCPRLRSDAFTRAVSFVPELFPDWGLTSKWAPRRKLSCVPSSGGFWGASLVSDSWVSCDNDESPVNSPLLFTVVRTMRFTTSCPVNRFLRSIYHLSTTIFPSTCNLAGCRFGLRLVSPLLTWLLTSSILALYDGPFSELTIYHVSAAIISSTCNLVGCRFGLWLVQPFLTWLLASSFRVNNYIYWGSCSRR